MAQPNYPSYVGSPTWVRIVMPVLGALFAAIGVLLIVTTPSTLALGIVFIVAGVFFGFRLARAGIVLWPDRLAIRGAVSSRTIPKRFVTGVDRLPSIDWKDEHDITHSSIVFALTGASNGHDPNARMRQRAKATLTAWLAEA